MGSVLQVNTKVADSGRGSPLRPLLPEAGPSLSTEGEGHEGRREERGAEGHLEEEEEDGDDDDSTEGDREEGKVMSAERPPGGSRNDEAGGDKPPPPLTEYIVNVVHFLDAILSNNSTDDHMREFIQQGGMQPLLKLLSLPVLPLDFPTSPACTAITGACRSIMVSAQWEPVPL